LRKKIVRTFTLSGETNNQEEQGDEDWKNNFDQNSPNAPQRRPSPFRRRAKTIKDEADEPV
jgi:hypothetical protein